MSPAPSGDPDMWADIFRTNRRRDRAVSSLPNWAVKQRLDSDDVDAILEWLGAGKTTATNGLPPSTGRRYYRHDRPRQAPVTSGVCVSPTASN
jgi:hypothetical protein